MLPTVFADRFFDDFFNYNPFSATVAHKNMHAAMRTDVRELENAYQIDMDLPGFKKEDVKLELNNGRLTVTATRTSEEEKTEPEGAEKTSGVRYLHRERFSGTCSRSFSVSPDLEPKDVTAKFENGILELSFPKEPAQKTPESRMISIA